MTHTTYAVRHLCSDFMDMLRHLISCRIVIVIIFYTLGINDPEEF